jgi:hypothetical protein
MPNCSPLAAVKHPSQPLAAKSTPPSPSSPVSPGWAAPRVGSVWGRCAQTSWPDERAGHPYPQAYQVGVGPACLHLVAQRPLGGQGGASCQGPLGACPCHGGQVGAPRTQGLLRHLACQGVGPQSHLEHQALEGRHWQDRGDLRGSTCGSEGCSFEKGPRLT